MSKQKTGVLKGLAKPVAVLLILVVFFVAYNTYLVDRSLETLRLSLEESATASSPITAQGIGMLLNNALLSEVTRKDIDLSSVNTLDVAASIVDDAKTNYELKGSVFAVEQTIKQKEKNRPVVLQWLDFANREIQKVILFLRQYVSEWWQRKKAKVEPMVHFDLVQQGKKLEKRGDFEGAKRAYEKFLELNQGADGAGLIQTRLAFVLVKLGQYRTAETLLSDLMGKTTDRTELKVAENLKRRIGEIEKISVEREKLYGEIRKMTKVDELQQAYFQLGLMDAKLYDIRSAQKDFKKVIDLDPKSKIAGMARFNLGFAYKMANDVEESADIFKNLSKTATTPALQAASTLQLASVKKMAGKFEEAAAIFQEAAAKTTDSLTAATAQFGAGYIYLFNLNDPKKAQKAFGEVRKIMHDDDDIEAVKAMSVLELSLREYAFSMFEKGDLDKAKEAFETIISVNNNDAWSHSGLGLIYAVRNDLKNANESVQMGYEILKDYYTTSALAYVEERNGNLTEAIRLNKLSIKLNSDFMYPYYNLGHIYLTQKEYGKALQVLKDGSDLAVKLGIGFPLLQNNLGLCYFYLEQPEAAIAAFSKGIKTSGDYVELWYNRALAYEAIGDKNAYEHDLKIAYRINPKYKDLKSRLAKKTA